MEALNIVHAVDSDVFPVGTRGSSEAGPRASSGYALSDRPVEGAVPREPGLVPLAGWVTGESSGKGRRVTVSRPDGGVVGSAVVTAAEESSLLRPLGLPAKALSRCSFVSDVATAPGVTDEVLPALLYFCGRRGRIQNRAIFVTAFSKEPAEADRILGLEPLPAAGRFESGGSQWTACAQRLDIALHRAWTAAPPPVQATLREQFVPEAVETLEIWIKDVLLQNAWFRAVREGTLTKEQYVFTLSNLHQFVRWTTRLIGRAVSYSSDKALRNKWLEHLRGEVDHEVIIESDLAALGADVDYVVKFMAPTVETQQFMVTQESMIGFHTDPVMFEAPPFVAEGYAAHLDQKFVDALRANARRWGIENPKQVTAFLASHITFDGGYDGHWELGRRMLGEHLGTNADIVRFMNVARLCMDSVNRSYTSFVEDLAIYGSPAQNG